MKKAVSTLVSYVMVAAISVVAISIVLAIGLPAIDRAKDAALVNEAKNIMQSIDSAARQVLFEGNGAQRVFPISSTGGDYFVEKDTDTIRFKLDSVSGVIDPGTSRKEGNLLIVAGADVKAYEVNYSADPSLVGYWKLNSVNGTNYTPDFTPNHNDGKLMKFDNGGNPPSNNFTAGKIGNALQLDGADDYVDAGNGASLNITNASTFETWIYPLKWNHNPVATTIIEKRTETSNGFMIFWLSSTNTINIDYGGSSERWNTGYLPPLNAWTHLAYAYNGTNGTFYVNGILNATTGKGSPSAVSTAASMALGKSANNNAYWFNGTIDEVRIYNRSLSADEIRQHYYQGVKSLELGTNLVLENSHIAFEAPKIGLPSSHAAINNSKLVEKITIKDIGLNITPLDSTTAINGDALSANGTGYTQLARSGDLLREASIKSYISSPSSGLNYEIWYTLRSNADFILEEIRNIVLD